MTRIYLFPGQGVQKKGMGARLFDRFPSLVAEAEEILGYSLRRLCLEDPDRQLDDTAFTQPALFVVNALCYREKEAMGVEPDVVAGHSLGEYCALFAAGVFDFVTGLRLVKRRGEIMGRIRGGGMAAVIGLEEDRLREVLCAEALSATELANLNSARQIVISGPREEILRAEAPLRRAGARHFVVLRVSGAFHSQYAADASRQFAACLREFAFAPPRLPVISNVYARPYEVTRIRETLSEQISRPVRWTDTIRHLMSFDDPEFEEIGPGNVLTGLLRYIRAESTGRDDLPASPSRAARWAALS